MRKWLLIGTVTTALSIVSGYWIYTKATAIPHSLRDVTWLEDWVRAPANEKDDGDAETSDTIEPLVVWNDPPMYQQCPPVDFVGPLSRVVLVPGASQPPRPDADPGRPLRMPYADEDEIFSIFVAPFSRIRDMDSALPNVFDEIDKTNPAEESERPETPEPPITDYHHHPQHCPYTGRCPYPNRLTPRD